MELAVAGSSEFTLGFRLTGVRNVADVKSQDDVEKMAGNQETGIIILDQETFDGLDEHMKEKVVSSIKPIFVVVSTKQQEELRKMIIRSIGVDLLRE